eukprot:TRINITY_DN12011_c0_g1_i1.p1 TRINITY_DN12011_c0_g1~~TRINITY_DN12011_c0_g1_i1.p1  ORF type:complete len:336 (+),score=90.27 TRINITY_DN12011_c0_g1_i1:44-1051(+)
MSVVVATRSLQGAGTPGTCWPVPAQVKMLYEKADERGYRRIQTLGEGAQGRVFRAIRTKDGKEFALKDVEGDDKTLRDMYKRAVTHQQLMNDGDHVVKYYDVYMVEKPTGSKLCIAMDYSPEGDLANHVRSSGELDEAFILKVALQVLDALIHMSVQNPPFLHMDIKPENILCFHGATLFKVTDFDASRSQNQEGLESGQDTTEEYRAPEISEMQFSSKCDVYSLGVVLYLLAALPEFPMLAEKTFNNPAYKDHSVLVEALQGALSARTYLAEDKEGELEMRHYTTQLVDLIGKMVNHDPKQRPSLRETRALLSTLQKGLANGKIKPQIMKLGDD